MTEWIKCSDRLPEIEDKTKSSSTSDDVLIIESCGQMYVAYLQFYGITGFRKKEEIIWRVCSLTCGCCEQ